MKTSHIFTTLAATVLLAGNTIAGPGKKTTAPAKAAVTYKVDASKSVLNWNAKKVTGEHMGTVKFNDGGLTFDGAKLTGGQFKFDMNSIVCTDLTDAGYNAKLIGHLKSEDFFSTAKHPTSTFKITKVTPRGTNAYDVTGDMTIKGITNAVTFPVTVKQNATTVEADGKVKLDRTKYDIKYGSKSFFEGIGDKAIYDEFDIELKMVANK